jgi:hypothetical protein
MPCRRLPCIAHRVDQPRIEPRIELIRRPIQLMLLLNYRGSRNELSASFQHFCSPAYWS